MIASPPCGRVGGPKIKDGSALRSSQAYPHPGTDQALRRFIAEVERRFGAFGMVWPPANPILQDVSLVLEKGGGDRAALLCICGWGRLSVWSLHMAWRVGDEKWLLRESSP